MSRTDKEALIFGLLIMGIMVGGTAWVAFKEWQRNTACAERGGIVVNLECGRFEPFPIPSKEAR